MRILSILAMVFLAVAVAAFPASVGKGAVGSAAQAAHLQHGDHEQAQSEAHDHDESQSANLLGHGSAACCDMTSCHVFALIPVPDASPAEMNSVTHLRLTAFALPAGLTSRLDRPPRAV